MSFRASATCMTKAPCGTRWKINWSAFKTEDPISSKRKVKQCCAISHKDLSLSGSKNSEAMALCSTKCGFFFAGGQERNEGSNLQVEVDIEVDEQFEELAKRAYVVREDGVGHPRSREMIRKVDKDTPHEWARTVWNCGWCKPWNLWRREKRRLRASSSMDNGNRTERPKRSRGAGLIFCGPKGRT